MTHHLTRNSINELDFEQITWCQNYTLIWLDKYVNNSNDNDVQLTKFLFDKLTDKVLFFDNVNDCNNYVKKTSNKKIILVVSGAFANICIPKLHNFQHIHSILIFCMQSYLYQSLKDQYSKIIDIFTDQKILIKNVQEIIDMLEKENDIFLIFNKSQKSLRDLTKESPSFLRFQLLKDVLLNLEDAQSDESKKEMVNTCKIFYQNDKTKKYLNDIEKFSCSYESKDVFRWYTKDSFVYKLLNKALRTEDSEALYAFRYYINDLCAKLKSEYQILKEMSDGWGVESLTLYRGLHLSKVEIKRLKQNKINLISTSLSKDTAKAFAGEGTKASIRGDVEAVIYEITVNFTINAGYFADIHAHSNIPGEQEYLFYLDVSFEIGDISYNKDEQITYVQLTATN
ncbi:unnamed protein product [Rotaria sp. Silwood2]|nr:unnamed protein product [Rotaria sp. Silwood2]CAF4060336.1 unnamed protein product [Rotaria sp. Silwood2]